MSESATVDHRRTPRIEGLEHSLEWRLNGREAPLASLRDLAVNSMRFEVRGRLGLRRNDTAEIEAHVPDLGLFLNCRSRVVRTYTPAHGRRGLALTFMDLDPAARGSIRALYPSATSWNQPAD